MKILKPIPVTSFGKPLTLDANASTANKIEALRIQNCTIFDESIKGLSNEHFCELFRTNDDLVFIFIEVNEPLNEAMKRVFDSEDFKFGFGDARRSWIVQIVSNSEKDTMIFFNDVVFSFVYISRGKIIVRGQFCQENNFDELVKEFLPDILRTKTLSLLDLTLTLNQLNENAEKGDLCRKFLKLFEGSEPESKRRKVELTLTQKEINEFSELTDSRNYNMLMLAIEEKDENLIDTLIELDFNLEQRGNDGKRAVDLAIDNKTFDVFVKLLEADSPFPESKLSLKKIPTQSEAFKKLVNFGRERSEFHGFVKDGNMEKLRTIISQSAKLKFAYDTDNKSALSYAIEHKAFDAHAFMLSTGFLEGIDPFYDSALKSLTENEKNEIAWFNLKYFQQFTSEHVYLLVSRTKVASRVPDRSKSYEEIWKFYNDLDEIPEVSEVLKVVSLFEKLTISFDFENISVSKMHPTQPSNSNCVFFEGGYIYVSIGNWQADRNEVLGIIAHEFTHCAMLRVYKNECLPFKRNDEERKREFDQIVESTQTITNFEDYPETAIAMVFQGYRENVQATELIVRVPHLLAKYKDDDHKLEEVKITFVDLFTFFEKKTLPDLSSYLETAKFAEQVKNFNDEAGLIREIQNEKIEFETNKAAERFEKINEKQINIVFSNSTIHLIAALIQHLDEKETFHIATNSKFLEQQIIRIHELFESNQELSLTINCADQSDECLKKFVELIIKHSEKRQIFLVFEDSERQKLTKLFAEPNFNIFEFNHNWQDLSAKYKTRIMQKVIKFQGNPIRLEDLLGNEDFCLALKFLPLNELVREKQLTVSESEIKSSKFFFSRRFFIDIERGKDSETDLKCNDVLDRVEKKSFAIISGVAGSGKTTKLKEIAMKLKKKFPDRWVSFIDLKQHVDAFKRGLSISSFEEFAFELTSNRSSKLSFEREMFKHFYDHGKVCLLLDGFDEISPHYKQIVSDFLLKFEPKQGNQLWITTRSHLQKHLEELFGVFSFELLPFNEEEQIQFLVRYWRKNSESNSSELTLESHARFVVKSFNDFLSLNDNFIGLPLIIETVALHCNENVCEENTPGIPETLNFYSLYEDILDRKIRIWRHDKGQLSEYDQKVIDKSGNAVLDVHQQLAMKCLLANKVETSREQDDFKEIGICVKYDENVWTGPTLSRVGLVLCSDDPTHELECLHRTFVEFLVAQFIVLSLQSENQTIALKVFLKTLEHERNVCQFLNFAFYVHRVTPLEAQIKEVKDYFRRTIVWRSSTILSNIIKNKNQEKIFWLFMKITKEILTVEENKAMITLTSHATENIFHLIFRYGSKKLIQEFSFLLREFLSAEEFRYLLIEIDTDKRNILHRAAKNSSDALTASFEVLKLVLTCEEQKNILQMRDNKDQNVFKHAAQTVRNDIFPALIALSRKILSNEEIRSMLKEKDVKGRNIFYNFFGNVDSVVRFEVLNEILNHEEIVELISNVDHEGDTFLKNLLENGDYKQINNVFVFLEKHLSNEQLKQLLRMRNKENQDIFDILSEKLNDDRVFNPSLEALVQNAKKYLPEEEIKSKGLLSR